MNAVDKLDKNFAVKNSVDSRLDFYDCLEAPFRIFGLLSDQDGFARMPAEIARTINEKVAALFRCCAGGRVRFRTDSKEIAIRAKMSNISRMPHFPITGTAGFDLYEGNAYRGTFVPPYDIRDGYESAICLPGRGEKDLTIHFPLYSDVISLEIGLAPGASLLPAAGYSADLPVIYYGSSITQGGCASRPGNSYPNIISRNLDCDHVNLGFSGGALAEQAMASYVAGLPMSIFVYDYDCNAPNVEYLQNTHQQMFQIIREHNPLLPIVMASRPQPSPGWIDDRRRNVIMATYQEALAAGDKNVYFIDGSMVLHQFGGDSGTVDGLHPNDLGFMCMANAIGSVLARICRSVP